MDSVPCLKAWADSLGGITYPLLSDFYPHGEVAEIYGVLRPEGYSERALFVIDKKGIIRYIDVHDIDQQPDNEVLFSVLAELEPGAKKVVTQAAATNTAPTPEPAAEVVMYCTPWCPDCRRARIYLKELGAEFVEIDITRDREAAQRVRGWAGGKEITPTFKIKGQVILDFDKTKIQRALNG